MKKYYTRVCNFYYGNTSAKLVTQNKNFPLNGNKKTSFNKIGNSVCTPGIPEGLLGYNLFFSDFK